MRQIMRGTAAFSILISETPSVLFARTGILAAPVADLVHQRGGVGRQPVADVFNLITVLCVGRVKKFPVIRLGVKEDDFFHKTDPYIRSSR
jgi:hypothetical protein